MVKSPYNSVNDRRLLALTEWLQDNDFVFDHLTAVANDAGFRRYFRLHKDNSTLMAVDAPPENEDTPAFLDIANRLSNSGLRTPKVHCYSLEKGFLVVDDLGLCHLQQALGNSADMPNLLYRLYPKAMQTIIHMQKNTDSQGLPDYDRHFLKTELELFPIWYLQTHLGQNISNTQSSVIENTFDLLIESALEQPLAFVHRDFHSRNLMMLANEDIGIIDFQGAMCGPITYDPASLLNDVYQHVSGEFRELLFEQHRMAICPDVDKQTYHRWLDFMSLQRNIKIMGIFCRLNYKDNKPGYLNNLNRVRKTVEETLAHYDALTDFSTLIAKLHMNHNSV